MISLFAISILFAILLKAATQGTANFIAKFDGSGNPTANSVMFDNGTNVGIGTTNPAQRLDVAGTIRSSSGGFMFPDGTTQVSAAEVSGGCFDPASHGAVPNDGLDDREPAQRAIDEASVSGGDVCFGPGVWDLTRSPPGTYNRFAALSIHSPRVNIRGAGKYATTLKMSGDVGGSTMWTIALDPGTDGTTISDLAIDTAETFHQDEQSHVIAIGTSVCAGALCATPIANVTVQRVSQYSTVCLLYCGDSSS